MEIAQKLSIQEKLKGFFLKEKLHFLARQEINWKSISKCAGLAVAIGVFGILVIPSQKEEVKDFNQKVDAGSNEVPSSSNPTQETLDQLAKGGHSSSVQLSQLYASSGASSPSSGDERNSSMILARNGLDSKTQLPPGTRLSVKLYEKATVSNSGMPVIGIVTKDFIYEDNLAVPQGSKVFGVISYEESGDRAKIDWNSVQFPDGRDRPLSAIAVGFDGQAGVYGDTKSNAVKNTVGQTLTRFIGAYAEGSMQRGAMGGNPGGNANGWKNAVADTAKDRAENWANDLKKEKKWIEVSNTTEFYAVLTQNFAFRDPGGTYGR